MIDALSAPARDGSSKSLLFSSREHQDAQELFQLLSSLVKDEATTVDLEAEHAFVGLTTALNEGGTKRSKTDGAVGKGVFDGLTANRRSCVVCGYTEAVMHFGFDNIQLSLPFAVRGDIRITAPIESLHYLYSSSRASHLKKSWRR